MNPLILKYLSVKNIYFIPFWIFVSLILTFIQQEYVVIPQLETNELINKILKEQLLGQFYKYRWLSFIFAPLMLVLRVALVAVCIFIGSFLFENYGRMKYSTCFNISLKADIALLLYNILYSILSVPIGYEAAIQIAQYTSFLGLFDVSTLEPWLIALIGSFNIFELFYWLFLAKLLSIYIRKFYRDSLNFVISTYGIGFFIYLSFFVFIMLYISQ
jgi:hypothetical protein